MVSTRVLMTEDMQGPPVSSQGTGRAAGVQRGTPGTGNGQQGLEDLCVTVAGQARGLLLSFLFMDKAGRMSLLLFQLGQAALCPTCNLVESSLPQEKRLLLP